MYCNTYGDDYDADAIVYFGDDGQHGDYVEEAPTIVTSEPAIDDAASAFVRAMFLLLMNSV